MYEKWELLQRTLLSVEDWLEPPRRQFLPEAATPVDMRDAMTDNSSANRRRAYRNRLAHRLVLATSQ